MNSKLICCVSVSLFTAVVGNACGAGTPERRPAGDSATVREDSTKAAGDTAFQRRLARYRHDSRILDSLTRLANEDPLITRDSLYRVYRLAAKPQGVSVAEVNLLFCTESALVDRYGWVPAQRVIKVLRDTVFRDRGSSDGQAYFLSRASDRGLLDSGNCPPSSYHHPEAIDGTNLADEVSPPRLLR